MPAVSKTQRRLFGMALACKRGHKRACKGPAKRISRRMKSGKIREFARK